MVEQAPEGLVPGVDRADGDEVLVVGPQLVKASRALVLPQVVPVEQPVQLSQLLLAQHALDDEETLQVEQVALLSIHEKPPLETPAFRPERKADAKGTGRASGARFDPPARSVLP